ncbi:MAG: DUF5107 domain-containing protein [Ruminococcaceae bacterium]|nr:DUF5107 domain-containing protein [Oscillospiraceae bacterium]
MSIKIDVMTIYGAPLEGTNPLPIFHNKNEVKVECSADFPDFLKVDLGNRSPVLPYKMQDRYSRKRIPIKKKTIVMENSYLKAVFWPEDGGRLYSLFDKVNGRELLMSNPVYQPGNLALRNAWLSGGIEWNFGALGHHYFTCDNIFAAILKDSENNEFVRMYEFERNKNAVYQMDFHLPEDSPVLFAHIKVFNPFEEDTTTYWWTNIAIPEDGNTRVLSSTQKAIVFSTGMTYDTLPEISLFPGKDLSYPHNASRSFDYFFQSPDGIKSSWESGAYSDGLVFFDRATAPLLYHKMFCWGNHSAGKHWQDFLSDPDKGDYIEIQGGFARSQLHDKLFPAKTSFEWTHCFGGIKLNKEKLHQPSLSEANKYMEESLETVIPENKLLEINEYYSEIAKTPVNEKDIIHTASGWGALEKLRTEKEENVKFPESVCFPLSTIGAEQYPWLSLFNNGALPEENVNVIPPSYMVSPKWMKLLENSLENNKTWYSLYHYGVMLAEMMERRKISSEASRWGKYPEFREKAIAAFEESVKLQPSVWALRCLFSMANEKGDYEAAEKYYDEVFKLPAATVDFAFAGEYMGWLNRHGKYQKAWDLYTSMPENIQNAERLLLTSAQTAIKLKKLEQIEKVFAHGEYADIREGECTLTDIWFEYNALKMAKERGIEDPDNNILADLIDEAYDTCPPPKEIDFRMSFDRKNKYRISN